MELPGARDSVKLNIVSLVREMNRNTKELNMTTPNNPIPRTRARTTVYTASEIAARDPRITIVTAAQLAERDPRVSVITLDELIALDPRVTTFGGQS